MTIGIIIFIIIVCAIFYSIPKSYQKVYIEKSAEEYLCYYDVTVRRINIKQCLIKPIDCKEDEIVAPIDRCIFFN